MDVTISVYSLNKYLNLKNIYLENVHPESIRSGHCQEKQATGFVWYAFVAGHGDDLNSIKTYCTNIFSQDHDVESRVDWSPIIIIKASAHKIPYCKT